MFHIPYKKQSPVHYMRKESLIIRIIATLIILYLTIIIIAKLKKQNKSSKIHHYKLTNVYSTAMTKLEIRENLGRSTWTLLHTMAAVYPGIPSVEHKKDIINFIYLLSKLYPCGDCAQHFQGLLKGFPPKVGNHDEFVKWMCDAHNIVNKRLGKAVFECERVEERWECGCDG